MTPFEIGTDGGLSVGLAVGPLADTFTFNARDVHPPLYYLALRWWIDVSGASWVSLKWTCASGGVIASVAVARWVKSTTGRLAECVALIAITLSPAGIIAAGTVRDFSWGLAATMLSVLSFWLLATGKRGASLQIVLAVTTASAGLTWYFHLPIFFVELLAAIVWRQANRTVLPLLVGAACWLPWWLFAGSSLVFKLTHDIISSGGHGSPAAAPVVKLLAVAGGWYVDATPTELVAVAAWSTALISLAVSVLRRRRAFAYLCTACVLAGCAMLWYVATRWAPPAGLDRYGLVITPLLVAAAASSIRRMGAATIIALVWAGIALPTLAQLPLTRGAHWSPDEGLNLVLTGWRPGDAVAFDSVDRLGYFAVRGGDPSAAMAVEDIGGAFLEQGARTRIARRLPRLESDYSRIWYVSDNTGTTMLEKALDRSTLLVETWKTTGDRFHAHGVVRLYVPDRGRSR